MPTQVSSISMVNIDVPEMLVTRDLLGELSKARSNNNNSNNIKKKVHMEKKINIVHPREGPRSNWDTFLLDHRDLKPEKLDTQRISRRSHSPNSPLSSSSSSINYNNHPNNTLNSDYITIINPSHNNPTLKPLLQEGENCSLELKLNPSTPSSQYYNNCLSQIQLEPELVRPINYVRMSGSFDQESSVICTLDKVKSALERVSSKKRPSSGDKELLAEDNKSREEARAILSNKGGVMFAAGCPGCLLYVIASRDDPKCPRCNYSFIPTCVVKKPRIDLNDVGFGPLRYGAN